MHTVASRRLCIESSTAAQAVHHYDLRRKSGGAGPSSDAVEGASTAELDAAGLTKRSRLGRGASGGAEGACTARARPLPPGAHYLQHELPDEVLLKIFSYLLEFDLAAAASVCKRFTQVANDTQLW